MKKISTLAFALFFALIFSAGALFAQGLVPGRGNQDRERPERPLQLRRQAKADAAAAAETPVPNAAPALRPQAAPQQAVPQAVPQQTVPQTAAQNASQAAPQAAASDPNEFVIPEGATTDELFKMADRLMNTEKEFNTEEEYKAWLGRMIQTVFLIARTILASNPDDAAYVKASDLKGEMIYSHGISNPDSFAVYEKFVREAQKDERLQKSEEGRNVADSHLAGFLHWSCTRTVQQKGSVEDLKKTIDEYQTLVLRNPALINLVPDLIVPVSEYSVEKKDPTMMKEVFAPLIAALKGSDNTDLKEAAVGLEGIIRFAELPGKPFEIVGTLADGSAFDPASLKGKVVLVNFWATWVTPCLAQYPDLLALYIQYQDRGFEIVGYSTDEEVEKLNDYLTTKKVLWPNLSETLSRKNKITSLTDFYGITGLPTLILIGRDGRVIATDLEIGDLRTQLETLMK